MSRPDTVQGLRGKDHRQQERGDSGQKSGEGRCGLTYPWKWLQSHTNIRVTCNHAIVVYFTLLLLVKLRVGSVYKNTCMLLVAGKMIAFLRTAASCSLVVV